MNQNEANLLIPILAFAFAMAAIFGVLVCAVG